LHTLVVMSQTLIVLFQIPVLSQTLVVLF
jgi:hypothetical protein